MSTSRRSLNTSIKGMVGYKSSPRTEYADEIQKMRELLWLYKG